LGVTIVTMFHVVIETIYSHCLFLLYQIEKTFCMLPSLFYHISRTNVIVYFPGALFIKLLSVVNGTACFKNVNNCLIYQHLLLLRDIWW
jgi:hypothetical protein